MMQTLSLLRHHPTATVALRHGRSISGQEFLSTALTLAATLPQYRYTINLCTDRYWFAVAFAAALMRRQTSLMPPNQTPDFLDRLQRRYPDSYRLNDDEVSSAAASTVSSNLSPSIPGDHIAAILFTSGSTGEPQPHSKSWAALVRSAEAELGRFAGLVPPGMAVMATVPAQHMFGLESTVMMCLQGQLTMHCGRPFFPADVCKELEILSRPRALVTTPVHLRAVLEGMDVLPKVDFILCATAPLAPQLAAEAEARFGAQLHEIYGCTEAGQIATRRTVHSPEWRPYSHFRLRQDEKGTWLNGGHVSEDLLLSDVIEFLPRSTFLLHGRTGDMINIAGKRTSLATLNYHLNSIPGVRDGVFVVPAEAGGAVTRLSALVVAPELTEYEILEALKQRIDAAFLPRPLRIVTELPRNDVGKLPRAAVDACAEAPVVKAR